MPVEEAVVLQELREPFDDLLSLVERRPSLRVLDVAPGGGELSRDLEDALVPARTVSIDGAQAIASASGGEHFDLVFSSATLHLTAGHRAVLRTLAGCLNPGGQLAIQMPASGGHPANTIAAAVARQFGLDPRPVNILSLDDYAETLYRFGFKRQVVRMQVYGRLLPSTADVFDCVRQTILAAYEPSLPPPTFDRFLLAYRDELRDGIRHATPYFYADKRLLIWAAL